ncbi:MAG: WHG domain-containing protein [Pseudomonadota bacterium]
MPDTRSERKAALRERLVDAAHRRIARDGLGALRARDLAAEAGCALGSLYTAFADIDALILAVNARTLVELGTALARAADGKEGRPALQALAGAYARFAFANTRAWSALFEHRMADGGPSPDWFLAGHAALFERLKAPLAVVEPHLSPEALDLRARTCFAAVHGIIALSVHNRHLGLPGHSIASELEAFVDRITMGAPKA